MNSESFSRHFLGETQSTDELLLHVLQWNILAQALSYRENNFIRAKPEAVSYDLRKWRILEQITHNSPDLCSLQEVDIYDCFLKDELPKYGYSCFFTAKINSKCLDFRHHVEDFKGPDGILLCYRRALFREISRESHQLPDDGRGSKEIFAVLELEHIPSLVSLVLIGTHLKSKSAFIQSRLNQTETILQFMADRFSQHRHVILTGDFNGTSAESFYFLVQRSGLRSAYRALMSNHEPDFTMCKIKRRNQLEVEERETVDYIFYKPDGFIPVSFLSLPSRKDIGPDCLPSEKNPSDHLALESKLIIRRYSSSI